MCHGADSATTAAVNARCNIRASFKQHSCSSPRSWRHSHPSFVDARGAPLPTEQPTLTHTVRDSPLGQTFLTQSRKHGTQPHTVYSPRSAILACSRPRDRVSRTFSCFMSRCTRGGDWECMYCTRHGFITIWSATYGQAKATAVHAGLQGHTSSLSGDMGCVLFSSTFSLESTKRRRTDMASCKWARGHGMSLNQTPQSQLHLL